MHRVFAIILLLLCLAGCSRPSPFGKGSHGSLQMREGFDYLAFRVDSVWAYVALGDSAAVRDLLPLLKTGLLRGDWLRMGRREPHELRFSRGELLFSPSEWVRTVDYDSLKDIFTQEEPVGQVWGRCTAVDSSGAHFDVNLMLEGMGGAGNCVFRLDIDPVHETVTLHYLGIQV